MQDAAARLDYETAGTYRDWLHSLKPLLDRQERIAAPVLDHNAVLVLPGVAGRTVQLLLVRFGRLAHSIVLPPNPGAGDLERLRTTLAAHYDPGQQRPERYHRREVDEVRLLAHWLYTNRESIHHVYWNPDEDPRCFLERVLAAVSALEGVC
jgi:DNA polymerase-3 subunit epsilon